MIRHPFSALLFGFFVVTAACATAPVAEPGPADSGSQSVPFDQQFIDMMVPHHEGAVAMARIAETRAQRPEIKAMAAEILRTQDAEIQQMKAWRRAWFGSDQTPPMSQMPMVDGMAMPATGGHSGHGGSTGSPSMMMDMGAEVAELREAPDPFDQAFIDAMIPHHVDAIAAARAAEERATSEEIKSMARAIIEAQEREVAQMREWRTAWFPN